MLVENTMYPTPDQLAALAQKTTGPLVMVNLLKFRDRAAYKDGSDADLPGADAYERYADAFKTLLADVGGRILFWGAVQGLSIGSADELWDAVVLVEYPSGAAFVTVANSPDIRAITGHRKAGLKGQLLLATTPR